MWLPGGGVSAVGDLLQGPLVPTLVPLLLLLDLCKITWGLTCTYKEAEELSLGFSSFLLKVILSQGRDTPTRPH